MTCEQRVRIEQWNHHQRTKINCSLLWTWGAAILNSYVRAGEIRPTFPVRDARGRDLWSCCCCRGRCGGWTGRSSSPAAVEWTLWFWEFWRTLSSLWLLLVWSQHLRLRLWRLSWKTQRWIWLLSTLLHYQNVGKCLWWPRTASSIRYILIDRLHRCCYWSQMSVYMWDIQSLRMFRTWSGFHISIPWCL